MRWLAGAAVVGVLVVAAPATAAVTIGPKPLPDRKGVFGGSTTIFMTKVLPEVAPAAPESWAQAKSASGS